jgi:hypothetical protein
MTAIKHLYEVRPRKDHRGVDLISDALPFGRAVVRRTGRHGKRDWITHCTTVGHILQYSGL